MADQVQTVEWPAILFSLPDFLEMTDVNEPPTDCNQQLDSHTSRTHLLICGHMIIDFAAPVAGPGSSHGSGCGSNCRPAYGATSPHVQAMRYLCWECIRGAGPLKWGIWGGKASRPAKWVYGLVNNEWDEVYRAKERENQMREAAMHRGHTMTLGFRPKPTPTQESTLTLSFRPKVASAATQAAIEPRICGLAVRSPALPTSAAQPYDHAKVAHENPGTLSAPRTCHLQFDWRQRQPTMDELKDPETMADFLAHVRWMLEDRALTEAFAKHSLT